MAPGTNLARLVLAALCGLSFGALGVPALQQGLGLCSTGLAFLPLGRFPHVLYVFHGFFGMRLRATLDSIQEGSWRKQLTTER